MHRYRTSWARTVQFNEKDTLPSPQHELAALNRDHEIAADYAGSEVRPRIVVHAVMPKLRLWQQITHNGLKVVLEAGFAFVDKYARGSMQTEDTANAFLNAGFCHGVVKVTGYV